MAAPAVPPAPLPTRRGTLMGWLGDAALATAAAIGVLAEWGIATDDGSRPRNPSKPGGKGDRDDFGEWEFHNSFESGEHDSVSPLAVGTAPLGNSLLALLVVSVGVAAAMLLRRRYPFLAMGVAGFAAGLASIGMHSPFVACAAFGVSLYALTAARGWAAGVISGAVSSVVVAAAALVNGGETAVALFVLYVLLVVAIPVLGAVATRSRRAYLVEVERRLAVAEQERAAEAGRAVAEERVSLARDLHDVLAHSLTVVTMQVGVASHLVDHHPDRAKVALEEARLAGAAAMDELRTTLALLRGEAPESRSPVPSLIDIDALVARVAATGLPVTLHSLPAGTPPVPEAVGLVAYRVVQESLTNVVKHAGPTTATAVYLSRTPSALEVAVTDAGGPSRNTTGSGLGLTGLAERVHALGGTFRAEPVAPAGFAVHAILPLLAGNDEESS